MAEFAVRAFSGCFWISFRISHRKCLTVLGAPTEMFATWSCYPAGLLQNTTPGIPKTRTNAKKYKVRHPMLAPESTKKIHKKIQMAPKIAVLYFWDFFSYFPGPTCGGNNLFIFLSFVRISRIMGLLFSVAGLQDRKPRWAKSRDILLEPPHPKPLN